ncbi:MAG: hypothetical protein KF736_04975 [Acidobacteria bacterium]|nr:hypothetical protein [Acidobacteriota bacterium]MCW5948263.1 hypothetical protein [Pyrinomonadaceae bacterium]
MLLISAVVRHLLPAIFLFSFGLAVSAQPDSLYRIPAGTRIELRMEMEINSRSASVGDTFVAVSSQPVKIQDITVLPTGIQFEGSVRSVARGRPASKGGILGITIDRMVVSDVAKRSIEARVLTRFEPRSISAENGLSIAGGSLIGAIIGFASRGSRGAVLGAGLGAGVGTGVALGRRGPEVFIRAGQKFEIELESDLILPVLDN